MVYASAAELTFIRKQGLLILMSLHLFDLAIEIELEGVWHFVGKDRLDLLCKQLASPTMTRLPSRGSCYIQITQSIPSRIEATAR
jgi:hypothetical protein